MAIDVRCVDGLVPVGRTLKMKDYVRVPGPISLLPTMKLFILLLVAGCLAALPSLANANPPDPLWIDGIYDAADADDAVTQAAWCDALGLRSPAAPSVLGSLGFFVAPAASAAGSARSRWRSPRSPPVR